MPEFEFVSRPFVAGFLRPAEKTTKPEQLDNSDVQFAFGSAADDAFTLRATNRSEIPAHDDIELSRKYDTVRVRDPNNSDNAVEVEVATEFSVRNKIDDSRFKIRYGEQQPSSNIDILRRNQTRKNPNAGD